VQQHQGQLPCSGYERLSCELSQVHHFYHLLCVLQQSGTRVYFWGLEGEIQYGTVQSTSRSSDVSIVSLGMMNYVVLPLTFITDDPDCGSKGGWRAHCVAPVCDSCYSLFID
jgi:hypothetical protein